MIFKKPYILLIKYFRLIHLILGILTSFVIYRINIILKFFNDYLKGITDITGMSLQDNLFDIFIFIIPIIILIVSVLLLWLMLKKKKPFRFYLYNTLVFLLIIGVLIYIYNYVGNMNQKAVDILIVRTLRDILIIIIFLQSISLLIEFIRMIGFDIKNFEFMSDLNALELSDDDLEEFEVDFNFDSNERKRKRRKYLRFLKYSYKENKFFIICVISIILIVFGYLLYKSINVYSVTNREGKIISSSDYEFGIANTYLIREDSRGNLITNDYLVVVNLKIKSSSVDKISSGNFKLVMGDNKYSITNKYDNYLLDLGKVYNNDYINNEFKEYLLVFEIPYDNINKNIYLVVYDLIGDIKVKLKPIEYEQKVMEYKLGDELIIDDNSILINEIEISDKFTINYDYCIKGECFSSIQNIVPSLNTNYDKTIIRIDGNYNNLNDISGIGYLEYVIDNNTYISNLEVISGVKNNDYNYFEVNSLIKEASSIRLIFSTRECKYVYNLR